MEKIKESLLKKYPNKSDFIDDAIEDATNIYRNLRRSIEQTEFNAVEKNWIKRCANELLANSSYVGVSKYSENGFSIEKFSSEISPLLLKEVCPKVNPIS